MSDSTWRVRLLLSYDGTNYCGWQRQADQPSVQAELEKALSRIYQTPVTVLGSGRTDSGVHALAQNAHFNAPRDPRSFDLAHSLNGLLPSDIAAQRAWLAPDDFHALASAQEKTYVYRLLNRRRPCPLRRHYVWHVHEPLDQTYLQRCVNPLIGQHDFKSFQSTGTVLATTVRELYQAQWERHEDELHLKLRGNGFLKQMVRNIVGTVIHLARNDQPPAVMAQILAAHDRTQAGKCAPPQGLCLTQVLYPVEVESKCQEIGPARFSSLTA